MNNLVIYAEDICKSFDGIKALDKIDLNVSYGEIFGLLGADGAGKSTLFRILTTLLSADSGNASICGYDVKSQYREIRHNIGYMPGNFSLYSDLSVEENLAFYASLLNVKVSENYKLIEPIYKQLTPFRKRRAGKLSGGMKQKLALCCALIHNPKILFLDEPTTGVDAVSRKEFWNILTEIKATGMAVLVSTPYMDEATQCDRVALINRGKILTSGTPEWIIANNPSSLYAVKGTNNYHTLLNLRQLPGVKNAFLFGDCIHLSVEDNFNVNNLVNLSEIIDFKPVSCGIEDVFIKLMSNGNR